MTKPTCSEPRTLLLSERAASTLRAWIHSGMVARTRSERGPELSLIALVHVTRQTAFALSAEQTPPRLPVDQKQKTTRQRTQQPSRMDFYLEHLRRSRPLLPAQVRYGVFDGALAKHDFVHGVLAQDLHLISRLRSRCQLALSLSGREGGARTPAALGWQSQLRRPLALGLRSRSETRHPSLHHACL